MTRDEARRIAVNIAKLPCRMTSELQLDDALKLVKPNCVGSALPSM
jgi:hypothetical protein